MQDNGLLGQPVVQLSNNFCGDLKCLVLKHLLFNTLDLVVCLKIIKNWLISNLNSVSELTLSLFSIKFIGVCIH